MKVSGFAICASAFVAAVLVGCGRSQPSTSALGAMPQTFSHAAHADRGTSWMLPEAKNETLLYASGSNLGDVYAFSFPAGKLVGTLTGFIMPTGECVDAAGNVWIADTTFHGQMYKYAHGGTSPIATLSVRNYPMACSVDPKTGNLAVTSGRRTLSIYPKARGRPHVYADHRMSSWYFCTYDNMGNLFLSGTDWGYLQRLVEQPYAETRFESINGIRGFAEDSPVFWDGKYIAIQANNANYQGTETIYRLTVSRRHAVVEKSVTFSNMPPYNSQFLTMGGDLVQPAGVGAIDVWSYEQGGLKKVIKQRLREMEYQGVVLSVAASR